MLPILFGNSLIESKNMTRMHRSSVHQCSNTEVIFLKDL
uniref:Uncharacterized protein n=1 Tax=Arundo donax TaxID=35708 RepID=A0A0A8Z0T7_ARUDO